MEKVDIFKDIAERTGGDIYLGVVGAVRTGKSTFIKKFMELVVLPNIDNEAERARTQDELATKCSRKNNYDDRTKICSESGSNCSC